MRKIIAFIFVLATFLFGSTYNSTVNAQYINIDGTNFNAGVMGNNCGIVSDDPAINRCCVAFDAHWQVNTDVPIARELIGAVVTAGNVVLDTFSAAAKFGQQIGTDISNNTGINPRENPYCYNGLPSIADPYSNPSACYCIAPDETAISSIWLCELLSDVNEKQACKECLNQDGAGTNQTGDRAGMWTGLGCVDLTFAGFIQNTVFGLVIGIAGMVALLCIIYCAFQLQTSSNNPEKIKETQELLTSCITGLIMIIFSILILRIVGVDLLRIPGFS
ncbi:MAG: pilin [Weeksellaceae bacterium]